jgi:hypothetical protein
MDRMRKAVAGVLLLIATGSHALALSPFSTVADWACAGEAERLVVARVLVHIAGHERPEMKDSFFLTCIDEAAIGPDTFDGATVSTVATGCVLSVLTVFSESG